MKISNKTIILVAIGIYIVYYMSLDKTQTRIQTDSGQLVKDSQMMFDNAQEQLYDWVDEGEDALEDTWNVLLEDTKQLSYYNDKI
tara:strand:- start:1020 stop:1274 length:255 start_codon:yes stop_codon:yes gene_type:complete